MRTTVAAAVGALLVFVALLLRNEQSLLFNYTNPVSSLSETPHLHPHKVNLSQHFGRRFSPIVVEEYKLLYFYIPKVGCTTWKRFLVETTTNVTKILRNPEVHIRHYNQLRYMDQYPLSTVNEWLNDPAWTKAIFVRDPKQRFLSAFLDKGYKKTKKHQIPSICCKRYYKQKDQPALIEECVLNATSSAEGFFGLMQICGDPHWLPQTTRYTDDIWNHAINFVGHFEHFYEDSIDLVNRIDIGGYEKYLNSKPHPTNANERMREFISPELEPKLDEYYKVDYENVLLGYSKYKLYDYE